MSEWEKLQGVLRKIHNESVKNDFKDDNELFNSNEDKAARLLKSQVSIGDNDSALTAIIKILIMQLYRQNLAQNIGQQIGRNFFGIPREENNHYYQTSIVLKFKEFKKNKKYEDNKKDPKTFQVSFRYPKQPDQIVITDVKGIENLVNRLFPESFRHYCGYDTYTYKDSYNNIYYRVPARSENEAITLCRKLVELEKKQFNLIYFKQTEDGNRTKEEAKGREIIRVLGERKTKYRKKRVGEVKLEQVIMVLGDYHQEYIISRNVDAD
ncbi:hypothetical protein A5482_012375 [Cyanobacterium sp. IPPAS B-1200]|uniref:hypothetical protein n=1 Tax=Cyanobacterium sp. IPPAS B-1200 TaxID=1562720 RepID=UPI000852713A|nr:hypothetical protein [Cyanobacterium sp. IPPAS B-1200]OEJ77954.1 hypothetical protein A5482_03820 [Cyanobacterium sp. IPPAS B-1200]